MSDCKVFSPGRCEIAGNHVDHQGGKVLTSTIDKGIYLEADLTQTGCVYLSSVGFEDICIDLRDPELLLPREEEKGSTKALLRGILAGFRKEGYRIGSCNLRLNADLESGAGLSSSAALEICLAVFFNVAYNEGRIDKRTLARIALFAENHYFGKPCGCMDQTAVVEGGVVFIDFYDLDNPRIERIDFSFEDAGLSMVMIDTNVHHASELREFSSVVEDMFRVAHALGKNHLSRVEFPAFVKAIPMLRESLDDRAVLRALHYFSEVKRVEDRAKALKSKDIASFMSLTAASGASSAQFLQNVSWDKRYQPVMLGLALVEAALSITAETTHGASSIANVGRGVCRIHGGGFGGNIQVFLPQEQKECFITEIEKAFFAGCTREVGFSSSGPRFECFGK